MKGREGSQRTSVMRPSVSSLWLWVGLPMRTHSWCLSGPNKGFKPIYEIVDINISWIGLELETHFRWIENVFNMAVTCVAGDFSKAQQSDVASSLSACKAMEWADHQRYSLKIQSLMGSEACMDKLHICPLSEWQHTQSKGPNLLCLFQGWRISRSAGSSAMNDLGFFSGKKDKACCGSSESTEISW